MNVMQINDSLINKVKEITVKVGVQLRKDYEHSILKVSFKKDGSLLTNSDIKAHRLLSEGLEDQTSWPVFSEEGEQLSDSLLPKIYWLIDPIDGTKEFLSGSGEFTVNIALMFNKNPILGFIYVPMTADLYWGGKNYGSFKENKQSLDVEILQGKESNQNSLSILTSHSYNSKMISLLKYEFANCKIIRCGSSLKFCLLAEGKADVYFRKGPTCEWDIAAGHAILKHSGGSVTDFENKEILYGKKDFKNPSLILKSKNLV